MDKTRAPDFATAAKALTPELISRFRRALELGKWPDGSVLSKDQKALILESLILAEAEQGIPEEMRTGYIDRSRPEKGKGQDEDSGSSDLIHKQ